jgi:hypothetical protein
MPRVCTICGHPDRAAIDTALVAGTALRDIARRHAVSKDALFRHRDTHLPAAMVQAAAETDVRHALDVVAQLKAINAAALTVLRDARAVKDGDLALKAIDRIYRQIELQAKLLGELDERPIVNVLVSLEWLQVRAVLLEALAAYPEARSAVSGRLVALEAAP